MTLAGGLFEASFQGQEAYIGKRRGGFTFNPEHSLQNYINIFNRWFLDELPSAQISDSIADYRDLIHIHRELNSPHDICAQASRSMLKALDSRLGELVKIAGVGT